MVKNLLVFIVLGWPCLAAAQPPTDIHSGRFTVEVVHGRLLSAPPVKVEWHTKSGAVVGQLLTPRRSLPLGSVTQLPGRRATFTDRMGRSGWLSESAGPLAWLLGDIDLPMCLRWLQGKASSSAILDEAGRPVAFNEAGWHVQYLNWSRSQDGHWQPARIEVRSGPMRAILSQEQP